MKSLIYKLDETATRKVESGNSALALADQMVVELLSWFKTRFFKWVSVSVYGVCVLCICVFVHFENKRDTIGDHLSATYIPN